MGNVQNVTILWKTVIFVEIKKTVKDATQISSLMKGNAFPIVQNKNLIKKGPVSDVKDMIGSVKNVMNKDVKSVRKNFTQMQITSVKNVLKNFKIVLFAM